MKQIFFLFLTFTCFYALKVQIFFPNGSSKSFGTLRPNEKLKYIFSTLNVNEITSQTPSGSLSIKDLAKSIKKNGIVIHRIASENFDEQYLKTPFFFSEKPNSKIFFFKFPNSTLIKDIIMERHPSSFALGVKYLLRFQDEITSIQEVNAFASNEFTMTIDQYFEQEKRVPFEKIEQNLEEIAEIVKYYRQKSPIFNGNETVNLKRVIVVCEDPSTGELAFKIIVPAFLGMNIQKLLDDFYHWSQFIIFETDIIVDKSLLQEPIENCVNYSQDGSEQKSCSLKAADNQNADQDFTTESIDCDQEVERIMTHDCSVLCQGKRKYSQINEDNFCSSKETIEKQNFNTIPVPANGFSGEKEEIFEIACELVESCKNISPLEINFEKLHQCSSRNLGAKKVKGDNLPGEKRTQN